MARVFFTQNLARHVDCPAAEAAGTTLREVLDRVFQANPRLSGYIVDEHGVLRRHMVVFVDGRQVTDQQALGDPVGPDSEVYVMQALSGG